MAYPTDVCVALKLMIVMEHCSDAQETVIVHALDITQPVRYDSRVPVTQNVAGCIHNREARSMMRMSVSCRWRCAVALTLAMSVTVMGSTCTYLFPPCQGDSTVVIVLANDSTTRFVSPSLGVCPNGMADQPHVFVDPAPVIAPGETATYTTCQIGGTNGDCKTFTTDFAVGLCGWQYGPTADDLTAVFTRFGGQIGLQFNCGDTVTLRWTDAGGDGGTWTSEVQPATGNPAPTADFQEL